jgi:hypothetical protein
MEEINTLGKVFEAGLLCDVHISYWTGLRKLTPGDLGLAAEDCPEDLVSLGRKRLLPKDALAEFKKVDATARKVIAPPNGFKFPATSSAYFIPSPRIPAIQTRLIECKARFIEALKEFQDIYPDERRKMMKVWESHLWQRALSTVPDGERELWVQRALERIDALYPTQDDVVDAFQFRWDWFRIAFPEASSYPIELEQDAIRGEMMQRYRAYAERRIEAFLENVVRSMRSATVELCEKWAEAICAGTSIHHLRLRELHNFIARFRDMNFVQDRVLEANLNELEDILPEDTSVLNAPDTGGLRTRIQQAMVNVVSATSNIGANSARNVVKTFLGASRAITTK